MFNNKPSKEPTEKQKIGKIGEDCACDYLRKEGYKILERNYLKKWGELDIVAQKGKKIHFVEVKSVSRSISDEQEGDVSRITSIGIGVSGVDAVRGGKGNERGGVDNYSDENISLSNKEMRQSRDFYRPEDNMHPWKLQRLGRAVQSYLLDRNVLDDVDWQFDLITVYVDTERRVSRVFLHPDIVL